MRLLTAAFPESENKAEAVLLARRIAAIVAKENFILVIESSIALLGRCDD